MKFTPTLHKLANGVTVILDPMDIETTNILVSFSTGSRDEAPHEQGLTHFCEHMLCKGTTRFPTQKNMDDYIGLNAGIRGAGTSNAVLEFYGRILAENINVLIDVLGDQIQNSLISPEKIEIERSVIADELRRALDNKDRHFINFIFEKLFNDINAGFKTLGTFENIAGFTRDQMLEFLSRRLSSKNCTIGISGKINDSEDVLKCLEKTFSFLKPIDVSENTAITYSPSVAHNSRTSEKNVKLRIFFPSIWVKSFENRFNQACVRKFNSFMIDKMYEVVRRENGLVYGLSGTNVGNNKLNLTGFSTETSAENIEKVVALIAKTAHQVYTKNEITDEDLNRFFQESKLGDAGWLESSNARCESIISYYQEHDRVYDFYDSVRMSESIRCDDVIKNSRRYFDGPMSIVTQGADYTGNLKEIWDENFKPESKFPKSLNLPKQPKANKNIITGEKCR